MEDGIMIVVKSVLENPIACILIILGFYCKYIKRKAY